MLVVGVEKSRYLNENGNNPLKALMKACGDGNLEAVMAISADVPDVNETLLDGTV